MDITTNNTETNPDVLIAAFWAAFPDYSADERERFDRAWQFLREKTAPLKRDCGLPYYLHPLLLRYYPSDRAEVTAFHINHHHCHFIKLYHKKQ